MVKNKAFPFVLVVLVIIFLFIGYTVKIDNIICKTSEGSCPPVIVNSLKEVSGENYFKTKNKIHKILDSNKIIQNFSIKYNVPNVFIVDVFYKKHDYCIYSKKDNKYINIDLGGNIINISEKNENGCILYDEFKISENMKISESDMFLLKINKKMNLIYTIDESYFESSSKSLVVKVYDHKIYFPDNGDTDYLVGSVALIISRLNDIKQGFKMNNTGEIDLRYKNPVVR